MTNKTYTNAELERLGDEVSHSEDTVEYWRKRMEEAARNFGELQGLWASASCDLHESKEALNKAIESSTSS